MALIATFTDACIRLVGINDHNYPIEKEYLFARSAFVYSWLGAAVSICYIIFYWYIGAFGATVSLAIMPVTILLTHFLYPSGKAPLLAKINLTLCCCALGGVVLHTGGIDASSAAWLLGTVPGISALLFRQVKLIIRLTVFTILLYSCIFAIEITGFNVNQLGYPVGSIAERVYTFVHFVGFSLFFALILTVFSITQKNLYGKLRENQTELEYVLENLNSIFETIDQAIFTIDAKGGIADNRSDKFECILGASYSNIYHIFENGQLGEESIDIIQGVVSCAVGDEAFQFEMNRHLLPKKMTYVDSITKEEKTLFIQWSPIIHENVVLSILVAIQDITGIEIAKQNLAEKNKKNAILLSLIDNADGTLKCKIESLAELCDRLEISLACIDTNQVKIIIHTIKGNARQLEMSTISEYCHELEDIIFEGKQKHEEKCHGLIGLLREYVQVYETHFTNFTNHATSPSLLNDIEELLTSLEPGHPLINKIQNERRLNVQKLVQANVAESVQIALELGKPNPEFIFDGSDIAIPHQYRNALSNALGHMIRNSLAHGIENSEEREKSGKSLGGRISIHVSIGNQSLIIAYHDDGKGLNFNEIEGKAKSAGYDTDAMNRDEICKLIFNEGLSTAKSLTDIAGRGIGMAAIKAEIEKIGGDINIQIPEQTKGLYINFEIITKIPLNLAKD